MMCDRCQQPMTGEESKPYEIPGAIGPGITLHLHKGLCPLPVSAGAAVLIPVRAVRAARTRIRTPPPASRQIVARHEPVDDPQLPA